MGDVAWKRTAQPGLGAACDGPHRNTPWHRFAKLRVKLHAVWKENFASPLPQPVIHCFPLFYPKSFCQFLSQLTIKSVFNARTATSQYLGCYTSARLPGCLQPRQESDNSRGLGPLIPVGNRCGVGASPATHLQRKPPHRIGPGTELTLSRFRLDPEIPALLALALTL